ncbi:MAG: ABC transporter permease [Spirochaetales bacterium]|nr:ABC transporter permease [Spirochaetales bacterium]
MLNESGKIISRRFMDRFLESGLLVIAVALGIGAASSGIALLANTISTSRELLESPAYKEIVVSTVGEADDMEEPVSLKAVQETAVLSSEDLDAADLLPAVSHAYVFESKRLDFINEESVARESAMRAQFEAEGNAPPADDSEAPPEDDFRPQQYSEEDLAQMAAESNMIISDLDEVNGYEVTPGFFEAWDIQTSAGSLFTTNDMNGDTDLVVIGSALAELFLEEGGDPDSLIGKKILTRQGLSTIIGIMENQEHSELFYSPYRSSAFGDFRRMVMNTQLRFTVDDTEKLDETAAQLQQWFDSQFGDGQIVISNPRSEAEQLISRNTGLAVLIMFLSLSGLFIASVNVSNILMSRAMRMKKHVGILMALGASRMSISKLFAWESAAITAAGALLGMVLSMPLGNYMQASLEISGGTWLFTLMGVLLSAALTLGFGLLPVRQYSKIDPAIAMRAA